MWVNNDDKINVLTNIIPVPNQQNKEFLILGVYYIGKDNYVDINLNNDNGYVFGKIENDENIIKLTLNLYDHASHTFNLVSDENKKKLSILFKGYN